MNEALVKSLLIEIDGSTEKLRRALREGGVQLDQFAGKANRSGVEGARGADAMATRQATAARTIAMTSETIARQGKITGETGKQMIAQVANMAFAFGKHGPLVGAIGISTVAIITLFTRVQREAAAAAAKAKEEFAKIAEEIAALVDAGDHEGLKKRARDIWVGTPSKNFEDGLANRERANQEKRDKLPEAAFTATAAFGPRTRARVADILKEEAAIKVLRDEYDALAQAILDARVPTTSGTARPIVVTAVSPKTTTKEDEDAAIERALASMADGEARMQAVFTALVHGFEGTRVDIEKSFAEMVVELEARGGQAEIPVLKRARDHALELADLLKANADLLLDIESADLDTQAGRSAKRDRSGPHEAAITALEEQRDAAKAIAADATRTDRERAAALALRKGTQAQINGLLKEENKEHQAALKSMREQALVIGQAIDGVLQLATAWGGVSREVTDVLRSLTQMAINVPALVDKLRDLGKAKQGTLTDSVTGELVSVGAAAAGVSTAVLPVLGALATIGATLFGSNPVEQERKRIQRENTDAIKNLTERMGSTGINLSGTDYSQASAATAALLASPVGTFSDDSYRINFRARVPERADRDAMERAAQELDVTLDGTIGSFRALMAAISEFESKLGEFGDSYDDQLTIINARLQVQGVKDPLERLTSRAAAGQTVSPVLKQLFDGLDLTKQEDRDALNKRLLELIDTLESGGTSLTKEQMGELTRDEILNEILQIASGLSDVTGAAAGPGSSLGGISGFRGLSEAAGSRLGDYTKAIADYARTAESQRDRMLQYLSMIAGTPLQVPALPFGGAGGGSGQASLQITISSIALGGITVTIAPGTDPTGTGTEVGLAVGGVLGDALYDSLKRALKVSGDLNVTPSLN